MISRGPFRAPTGGDIDRSRQLEFSFDARRLYGHPGDTLASALLANGVRIVGRSFKYHRPRGIVTHWVDEPNALVQLVGRDDEPNVRATTLPLTNGLQARSVNRWPSLGFDIGVLNDLLAPLFPAGFYYKTFMGGPGWNFFGPIIRRLAGLGVAPRRPGEHHYEKRFHHCDLLVVGAGPAGLMAALTAAARVARVMLVDDRREPGGQLIEDGDLINGVPGGEWVSEISGQLAERPNVVHLQNTTCVGYYDHNFLTVVEQNSSPNWPSPSWLHERLWKVRARRVLLCTGAAERPLVFADNDRPGVMQLQSALGYVKRYGVLVGRRAVVFANNDSAYPVVDELARLGIEIVAVVDVRTQSPSVPAAAEHLLGHAVVGIEGSDGLTAAIVEPLGGGKTRILGCDTVLMSGGWDPRVQLASQTGARPIYDAELATFVPGDPIQAESSAGAARDQFGLAQCLRDGGRRADAALDALGFPPAESIALPEVEAGTPYRTESAWQLPGKSRRRAFVDFQNDVTSKDIEQARRENLVSVEHVKRYTTTGMGTDQGKLGNINAIGLLAQGLDKSPGEVGTTTYRPPYTALSFGAITGNDIHELVVPARRTSMTDWIEAQGAQMFEAGSNYRRPSYFPRAGEDMQAAIAREARACRQSVGIYDGSPLGKFELQGPDVVSFLERIYTNRWANLRVGQGRFGLMLREDGRILDDGVTFRLDEGRYWMFCGTGSADHVQMHMERLLALEWPELEVYCLRVTSQWSNVCICGPKAREVLRAAGTDVDSSHSALPFMGLTIGHVAGIPARVARVGYTGETSFEINVPARQGMALWQALMSAGDPFDITPVGSEASMVMRCEKGFVAAGYEGDGIVNPYDAGLGWAVDESKPDFIGKRSLARDRNVGGIRPSVVGLLPHDTGFVPPDGTPLVDGPLLDGESPDGMPRVVGYVTQGCFSPNLERAIALAVVDAGRDRIGDEIIAAAQIGRGAVRVVPPCFIDPEGARMRGPGNEAADG
ncbi:MAG: FAD-dependent oxidoreductase [Gammaproteobacteria bacterium]|nr:FAD-dependent oxidoreductase [Gammaproteobacteria bacterium]